MHFLKSYYLLYKYLKEDTQSMIYLNINQKIFSKKLTFIYSYNIITNSIPPDQLSQNNRAFERIPISSDNRQFDILRRNGRA